MRRWWVIRQPWAMGVDVLTCGFNLIAERWKNKVDEQLLQHKHKHRYSV